MRRIAPFACLLALLSTSALAAPSARGPDPSGLTYHLLTAGDRYDMQALTVSKTGG